MSQNRKKIYFCAAIVLFLLLPPFRRCILAALLALLLAAIMNYPVCWLSKYQLPRWLSVALVFTGALALLGGLLYLALTRLCSAAGALTNLMPDLPSLFRRLSAIIQHLPTPLQPLFRTLLNLLREQSALLIEKLSSHAAHLSARFFAALPEQLFFALISLLATFYAALDWNTLRAHLSALLPDTWHKKSSTVLHSLKSGALCWLNVQGKLTLIQFVPLFLGLTLLHIQGAFFAAVLIALTDALPLLGSGTVLVPWALLLWLENHPIRALCILALWLLCWILRTVLEPRMVGAQAGISPFYSLLALYLGALTFGFWGLIAAPILLSAVTPLLHRSKQL